MKISCESCGAGYDLDEGRIPPSGMSMTCPACLHRFTVKRPGAAPPPVPAPTPPARPREIALSPLDPPADSSAPEVLDLPAPKASAPRTIPSLQPLMLAPEEAPPDLVDLPAPVQRRPPAVPELPEVI